MFSRLASLLTAIAVEPREKSHSGHAPALELRATRVMFKIGSLADFFPGYEPDTRVQFCRLAAAGSGFYYRLVMCGPNRPRTNRTEWVRKRSRQEIGGYLRDEAVR